MHVPLQKLSYEYYNNTVLLYVGEYNVRTNTATITMVWEKTCDRIDPEATRLRKRRNVNSTAAILHGTGYRGCRSGSSKTAGCVHSGTGAAGSHLSVDSVGDLLPAGDLRRSVNARGQGVALSVGRDLRGLRHDEACFIVSNKCVP